MPTKPPFSVLHLAPRPPGSGNLTLNVFMGVDRGKRNLSYQGHPSPIVSQVQGLFPDGTRIPWTGIRIPVFNKYVHIRFIPF